MKTIREKLLLALQSAGHGGEVVKTGGNWKLPDARAGIKNGKPVRWFFLGPAGALRVGQSWSNSTSLTDGPAYKALLAKAETILNGPCMFIAPPAQQAVSEAGR